MHSGAKQLVLSISVLAAKKVMHTTINAILVHLKLLKYLALFLPHVGAENLASDKKLSRSLETRLGILTRPYG